MEDAIQHMMKRMSVDSYSRISLLITAVALAVLSGLVLFSESLVMQVLFALAIIAHVAVTSLLWLFTLSSKGSSIATVMLLLPAMLCFVVAFSVLYYGFGEITLNATPIEGFGHALYFSVVTWSTLGYGDIVPANAITRTIASVEAIFGYLFMGILVAFVLDTIRSAQRRFQ